MFTMDYNKTTFLTSSAKSSQFPSGTGLEVAFIGRSNSGKSSAINALTRQKKLARTSKDPGRTQCINFFPIDNTHCLADLPGYGYANVPFKLRNQWKLLIEAYLKHRSLLRGLVLLMDIRHPFTDLDRQMLDYGLTLKLPVHVLLTKADKLKQGACVSSLDQAKEHLSAYGELNSIQLFSATKNRGIPELQDKLNQWFGAAS